MAAKKKGRSTSRGRKYGDKASQKVEKAMHERKHGTLRSGGTCAGTSPFRNWSCRQLGVRVPYRPRGSSVVRTLTCQPRRQFDFLFA